MSQIYLTPKLTSFVARNRESLSPPTISNRTNNIMEPNTNMAQSKVLVNLLLIRGDYWRRKKLTLIFFRVTLKTNFKGLFFGSLICS
jgi:hypothetical protein